MRTSGALVAVLCLAGSALADGKPKVSVVPFSAQEGAKDVHAQKFTGLLIEELKSREEVAWQPLGQGAAAVKPVEELPPSPALKEAQAAIAEGKKQVADLSFEAGAESLKKGIDGALADPQSADFAQLVDAQINLAVAQFRLGEEKAAQNALTWVARIDPDYALPEGRFPPVFLREFEKAKRRVEKLNHSNLTVDGPQGSVAFLNGKEIGKVPASALNLPVGLHYVRLRGKNGERAGQAVDLRTQNLKVKLGFTPAAPAPVASPTKARSVIDEFDLDQFAESSKAAGSDFLVVGVLYRSGEHQFTAASALYSAKAKGFARLKTFTFDDELSTANVEAFRLADVVSEKATSFGAATELPFDLVGKDVKKPLTAAAQTAPEPDVAVVGKDPSKVPLKPDLTKAPEKVPEKVAVVEKPPEKTPSDKPKDVSLEKPKEARLVPTADPDAYRPLGRPSVMVDPQGQGPGVNGGEDGEVKSGLPWWVYVAGGVGAAAILGGTYVGVTQANRPVTGTVTARW